MLNLSNPNPVVSALSQNRQQVYQPFAHTQPRERLVDVTPKHIKDFAHAQPHAQSYKPQVESTANANSTPLRDHRGYSHNANLILRIGLQHFKIKNIKAALRAIIFPIVPYKRRLAKSDILVATFLSSFSKIR